MNSLAHGLRRNSIPEHDTRGRCRPGFVVLGVGQLLVTRTPVWKQRGADVMHSKNRAGEDGAGNVEVLRCRQQEDALGQWEVVKRCQTGGDKTSG